MENCVEQGCDGASVMAGYKGGVQTFIREKAPSAIYVHCVSHALNLVLNHGLDVVRSETTSKKKVITSVKVLISTKNWAQRKKRSK